MAVPRILAFSGSLRAGSYNTQLMRIAIDKARDAGAQVTELSLLELDLPLMNEDLEKTGFPAGVLRMKELMREHQGYLICSPEYNASVPSPLKNAVDWASRRAPDEQPRESLYGKVVAILMASTGPFAGHRALGQIRALFIHCGAIVSPDGFNLAKAQEAFDHQGSFRDPKNGEAVAKAMKRLVAMTKALAPQ